jgi:multiple sugar transport system substrate-binding protein
VAYPSDDWQWDDLRSAALQLTVRDERGRATQYGWRSRRTATRSGCTRTAANVFDDPLAPTEFLMDSPEASRRSSTSPT